MPLFVMRDGAGGPDDPWFYSVGSDEWVTEPYVGTEFPSRQSAERVIRERGLRGARVEERRC